MPICPKCRYHINSLAFTEYNFKTGIIEKLKDKININVIQPLQRSLFIKCTECDQQLFNNKITACRWLKTGIYNKEGNIDENIKDN